MQIYADVLNARIELPETQQSVAMGAAILGCIAAGQQVTGYSSMADAIRAMSRPRQDLVYAPDARARRKYDAVYRLYRTLGNSQGAAASAMRELRDLAGTAC